MGQAGLSLWGALAKTTGPAKGGPKSLAQRGVPDGHAEKNKTRVTKEDVSSVDSKQVGQKKGVSERCAEKNGLGGTSGNVPNLEAFGIAIHRHLQKVSRNDELSLGCGFRSTLLRKMPIPEGWKFLKTNVIFPLEGEMTIHKRSRHMQDSALQEAEGGHARGNYSSDWKGGFTGGEEGMPGGPLGGKRSENQH